MLEEVKPLLNLSAEQREAIRRIAAKHGVEHVRIFGMLA
jgi:hypothetical protein